MSKLPESGHTEFNLESLTVPDTAKGELVSGGKGKIAMWALDTDYDDRSLLPGQGFFPMAGKDGGWKKLKKAIRAELNENCSTASMARYRCRSKPGKTARWP